MVRRACPDCTSYSAIQFSEGRQGNITPEISGGGLVRVSGKFLETLALSQTKIRDFRYRISEHVRISVHVPNT